MLTNELSEFDTLPGQEPGGAVITERWSQALFSDAKEATLKRYFGFHLERLSAAACSMALRNELTGHLLDLYGDYLEDRQLLPAVFYPVWYQERSPQISLLKEQLTILLQDSDIRRCLLDFIAQYEPASGSSRFSLGSIRYFEHFCAVLLDSDPAKVGQTLLDLNFNHLGYFACLQAQFREKDLLCLRGMLQELLTRPQQQRWRYHPDWPPLQTMLATCLREEIAAREREAPPPTPTRKLPLNLSVAQLACLIQLLYEENMFGTANLSEIFRCFSAHFSTKKQERISPGGLAKEYYGIGLVTAAVMQGKLKQMLARINRAFFPG